MFLPAIFVFCVGLMLLLSIVMMGVTKGNIESLIYLCPLVGGCIGLLAALFITFEIAGKSISSLNLPMMRIGLIFGVVTELIVIYELPPNLEPFMYYWFPPLCGALVLLVLSFKLAANKPLN